VTSYWIGVAAANHVAKGVAEGFAMFAHGKHSAAKRVKTGDWVAYYSPREGINEGAEVRQFTAIGRAVAGEPSERLMAPGITGWQRPMQWLAAHPADIYPLLDKFIFVSDRRHWGMYFRKSLFAVDLADFTLIAQAMGVSDHLN
jgi:hypothetical protein